MYTSYKDSIARKISYAYKHASDLTCTQLFLCCVCIFHHENEPCNISMLPNLWIKLVLNDSSLSYNVEIVRP